MSVADTLAPFVRAAVGDQVPVRVTCWDGSTIGAASPALHLIVRNRRALRRIVWAPNELGFARAYVSGHIEVEGDLVAGLAELDRLADPARGPGVTIDTATKKAIIRAQPQPRRVGDRAPVRPR